MSNDIVVLSLEPWDDVWRRNQYVVDGLLRRDPSLRVLFVEPSNDVLHSIASGRGLKRGRRLRTADGYGGRLRLYQPDKVLPRFVGPMADALLRSDLRRAIRRSGMTAPVLWVNDPSWAGLVGASGWPSLYDMTDDWLAADRPGRELARIAANEDVLMQQCAAVVVCSEGLRETRRGQREVILIPNAVDVDRYRQARDRPTDLVSRSALYTGTLHEDRLDVDLVLATADALSPIGGTVVLVGPSALSTKNFQRLDAHPAVVLLGARPWTEMPAYLQHAEVLIVPHVVDDFTESLDPIKYYEYRAVGRPVVSTAVAGFRSAPSGVHVASTSAFPSAVAGLLDSPTVSRQFDDVPDWTDRVAAFAETIELIRQDQ